MEEIKYLDFIRWSLHHTDAAPSFISEIDWQELLSFAKKQTIIGLFWQGIQRLGDVANKPSEDDVMDWMGEYTKIVRRYTKTDDAVAWLANFMRSNDIGFFVFKGQTVASYYPMPEIRTSGDVDFYVFKKDWDRAKSLLEKEVTITDEHSGQHLEFTKDGNFGKYGRKEQQSGWKHSLETGVRSLRHIFQFFWLSPAENLLLLPKLLKQSLIKNTSR